MEWSRLPRDIFEVLLPNLRLQELRSICGVNCHWNACAKGCVRSLRPSHCRSVCIPAVFSSLTSLDLGGCWDDVNDVRLIALSKSLAKRGYGIRSLSLAKCHALTNRGIAAVCASLPYLETLILSGCREPFPVPVGSVGYLGVDGETLVGLNRLRELDLSWNPVHDQSLQTIIALTGLTRLVLSECPAITDQGVWCLGALRFLRSLNLSRTMVSNRGLAAVGGLSRLESLSLRNCCLVVDVGLLALTSLPSLRELDLSHCNGVSDLGVLALGKELTQLTSLDLSYCTHVTGDCFRLFNGSSAISSLKLQDCNWVNESVLRSLATIVSLQDLDVKNCVGVTDRGLGHVVSLPLTSLNISHCSNISDDGLAYLATMKSLGCLDLSFCVNITDKGVGRLGAGTCLEHLVLSCCGRISDTGIHALAPLAGKLKQLEISSCHAITSPCIGYIARTFTELRTLKLEWLAVEDQDLLALKGRTTLCNLSIKGCSCVTDTAYDELWHLEGVSEDRKTPQQRMQ